MLDAKWEVNKGKAICYLRQTIPNYGKAEFVHRSDMPLQFSIQEQRAKSAIIKANLAALPAPWMHDLTERQNYTVFLDQPPCQGFHSIKRVWGRRRSDDRCIIARPFADIHLRQGCHRS